MLWIVLLLAAVDSPDVTNEEIAEKYEELLTWWRPHAMLAASKHLEWLESELTDVKRGATISEGKVVRVFEFATPKARRKRIEDLEAAIKSEQKELKTMKAGGLPSSAPPFGTQSRMGKVTGGGVLGDGWQTRYVIDAQNVIITNGSKMLWLARFPTVGLTDSQRFFTDRPVVVIDTADFRGESLLRVVPAK